MQVKLEEFLVPAELANQNNQQEQDLDNGFIKSKSNEKKDKETKLAEENKQARECEAKKATANDYITGMEGSVRPDVEASGIFSINEVDFESPDEILIEKSLDHAIPNCVAFNFPQ